ncbi:MAG TPA: endonuclease III, partial [Candidatus Obscuribacterales bacterium]
MAPDLRKHAHWVLESLEAAYPDAHCALNYRNAFELLIATILSAQCTDVRVNQVTAGLFARYRTPADFAAAEREALEQAIRPTGFFRNKAESIQAAARQIVSQHGGEVPRSMAELTALKGVGRKTASVVMGNAFGTV